MKLSAGLTTFLAAAAIVALLAACEWLGYAAQIRGR